MKFGPVPVAQALGAVAAHSVRLKAGVVRKGAVIGLTEIAAMQADGIAEIVVAQLEPGDLDENSAAARLAAALAGRGLTIEQAFTGRVNLFAGEAGLFTVDVEAVDAFNAVDEAITLATLPAFRPVQAGEMVATVKIIPYGLPEATVMAALAALARPPLGVAAYRETRIGVISTLLPGLKMSVVDKTLVTLEARLPDGRARVLGHDKVDHAIAPLAAALRARAAGPDDLIIVFGASAITDRRDVIPEAVVQAGGRIVHLGMPVDPGNLLMIGEIAGTMVIGAPGCARSPKENGFDWVLQRALAGLPVGRADLQSMGVGGLLMEIVSRPQPRAPAAPPAGGDVAAIVLAAGQSARMGARNKLTATVRDKPMLRHAVEAAMASRAGPVLVVTGHEADTVEAALAGLDVTFIRNPDYAAGLSTSLKAGLKALPPVVTEALVILGDMPNVTPAILDRLIAAGRADPEAVAVVPTLLGQRGNPVLLRRALFARIAGLTGDQGARRLLEAAGDAVIEVPLDDPAIALDVDTPEALKAIS